MEVSMDGLRFNMARNVLDFVDSLTENDIDLPEDSTDKLDQVLRDIRFLGCIDFRKDETDKDGGFIYEKLDKLFARYVED